MSSKLDELRNRFKTKKDSSGTFKIDPEKAMFPFWKYEGNEEIKIRFLPDLNEDNPDVFYITKYEHKLVIDGKKKTIPCPWTWGEKCPICAHADKYFKAGDKKTGLEYSKKKVALARVLITKCDMPPSEREIEAGITKYEGRTMNTQFTYSLIDKIKSEILIEVDEALDADVWGTGLAHDFILSKTTSGDFNNYDKTSRFTKKPYKLQQELADSVTLIDLKTLLPENLGKEKVQALLNAHLGTVTDNDSDDSDDDSDSHDHGGEAQASAESSYSQKSESKPAASAPAPSPAPQYSSDDDDDDDDDPEMAAIINRVRNKKN